MQKITDYKELEKKSIELKIEVIKMLDKAQSGHVGGAFSAADMLTALYYSHLNVDPKNPKWEDRDYFLISNGHICPIWYAILADLGYFDKSELDHLRQVNSLLQGHPMLSIPGVENASGLLGHGLSQAIGIAMGLKMDGKKNRVYCLTSDGEHNEGQLYEAAMFATKCDSVSCHKLDNLVVIVDRNHIQIEGTTEQILPLGDLRERYEALNWTVLEINGNKYSEIIPVLKFADESNGPAVIISNTIAGEEISFMEGKPTYHDWKGKEGEAESAIAELEKIKLLTY